MSIEACWILLGVALVAYVLTGGADFGAGILDLLARGPRKQDQRDAIAHALGPIWEANHIWLIFMVVLLFTVFPRAFAAITTGLHIPLLIALLGIVMRGSAFVFRGYGLDAPEWKAGWGRVFAWASFLTPLFLGLSLAALATGDIRWQAIDGGRQSLQSGFLAGWTTGFALCVGLFTTTLCALLASVYLVVQTEGPLRQDFRRTALTAQLITLPVGAAALALAHRQAPDFAAAFPHAILALAAAATVFTLYCLWKDHAHLARLGVGAQGLVVVLGWGAGMEGHLVRPDLVISTAGARPEVLAALLPALIGGGVLLLPALWYLYRVFGEDKRSRR